MPKSQFHTAISTPRFQRYLNACSTLERALALSVQEAIHKLGAEFTHDRLIARLTFGFWTYMFATKQFAAAGSILLGILRHRPFGTKQKSVFQDLIKINDLRNRIAHYEPICFDKDIISTARTEKRYHLILEFLKWLGCNPKQILEGFDGVGYPLSAIRSI